MHSHFLSRGKLLPVLLPVMWGVISGVGLAQQRPLWTTSRIAGSPDPQPPYRTRVAFPELKFDEPLAVTSAPGSDRLFVAERYGKIFSFENKGQTQTSDLLLDVGKVVYGLAFHPQFQRNGYFYVTYVLDDKKEEPKGTRVSRFQVRRDNSNRAELGSEVVLLEWPSGGHNGGCLRFGPDGYLYVATGDSSGIADQYKNGQDISNLSGAILRIDVDHQDEGRRYRIPADNPFVEVEGARGEIWAYGLRQPWKFAFDRQTGDLWTGNVGQDLWEQVFVIQRGGNYGWSVMEGSHPFRPERSRGPTPFVPPIVEHDHAEFRSITGGYVYHGSRLTELRGAYIYGDYDTGKIWMLRYDREKKQVTEQRELLDSTLRLVGFAEDRKGEVFLVDHISGRIYQLEKNPDFGVRVDFPRKLSETGLFASVAEHRPAVGVLPYQVAAEQWSDGATKERFLALPHDSQIEFDGITYPQPAPGAPHGWKFPDGTVAVETISMEMEVGKPASRRRLETRILHYEKLSGDENVGDQFWRGYTYVWNDEQTDAVLLEDTLGRDLKLKIKDRAAPNGVRTQTWRLPSRAECTVCHNMAAKYVLGINTLQINRDIAHDGGRENQLAMFQRLGLFSEDLPSTPEQLPHLVDPHDDSQELNARGRSYLHANCSHCHRKWGGGNGEFLLLSTVKLEEMGVANVKPEQGGFFLSDAQLIDPGHPYRSVLLYRTSKLGPGRMPRIGSLVVDRQGVALLHDWIAGLSAPEKPADPIAPTLTQLRQARQDSDRQRLIDQLLGTTGGALRLLHALQREQLGKRVGEQVVSRGAGHQAAHVRDLFEQFLPEEQRVQRLGSVIRPEVILALEGDAQRGRKFFLEAAGVQCRNCHKVQSKGADVGPDLSEIGKKYKDRGKLLDTILYPSREIEPKYRTYLLETVDGQVFTGLLLKKDAETVVLKDAKNKVMTYDAADVEQLVPQQQSLMPDLLLRDMTKEQVADLLAFLESLR